MLNVFQNVLTLLFHSEPSSRGAPRWPQPRPVTSSTGRDSTQSTSKWREKVKFLLSFNIFHIKYISFTSITSTKYMLRRFMKTSLFLHDASLLLATLMLGSAGSSFTSSEVITKCQSSASMLRCSSCSSLFMKKTRHTLYQYMSSYIIWL